MLIKFFDDIKLKYCRQGFLTKFAHGAEMNMRLVQKKVEKDNIFEKTYF